MPGSGAPWRGPAHALDDALARTARRYVGGRRFARHYVASKLRTDPVHRTVLDLAAAEPFGDVLDVGCGRGQLGIALLEAGGARSVMGLDWAGGALGDARRAGAGLAFTAHAQDLGADDRMPRCDTALVIDVLYILRQAQALRLLAAVAHAARDRVLVRTLDPALGWRSRVHLALERIGRPVWPHAGAVVDPAPIPALLQVLTRAGFDTDVTPCWAGTPFANVLLVARRTLEPVAPIA